MIMDRLAKNMAPRTATTAAPQKIRQVPSQGHSDDRGQTQNNNGLGQGPDPRGEGLAQNQGHPRHGESQKLLQDTDVPFPDNRYARKDGDEHHRE